MFGVDLRGVSVVTLFLSPGLNRELRPKLLRELAPGARVVSHWHDMGDWPPEPHRAPAPAAAAASARSIFG